MNITENEKRVRIAEACGFEWGLENDGDTLAIVTSITRRGKTQPCGNRYFTGLSKVKEECRREMAIETLISHLPDYFNDLNACHEMEKVIMKDETLALQYSAQLGNILDEETDVHDMAFEFHATAAQRCEAFGKTLNLW